MVAKPSERTFLFKNRTKYFNETVDKLKKYGNLFKDHLISFSFLPDKNEFQHLLDSIKKNIIKNGIWLPGAEKYKFSFAPAEIYLE